MTELETKVGIEMCPGRMMYVPRAWDLKEEHGALFTRDKAMQMAHFFFFLVAVIF